MSHSKHNVLSTLLHLLGNYENILEIIMYYINILEVYFQNCVAVESYKYY